MPVNYKHAFLTITSNRSFLLREKGSQHLQTFVHTALLDQHQFIPGVPIIQYFSQVALGTVLHP